MQVNLSHQHQIDLVGHPIQVGGYIKFKQFRRAGFFPFVVLWKNTSGASQKFWRIETRIDGSVARRWGKVGTRGQTKLFGTSVPFKVLNQKLKKGYQIHKPTGSFPIYIAEVRSNGDLIELVDPDGNIVWSDTPIAALKVLAVCNIR